MSNNRSQKKDSLGGKLVQENMTFVTQSFLSRLFDKCDKPNQFVVDSKYNHFNSLVNIKSRKSWNHSRLTIPLFKDLFLDVYRSVECKIFRGDIPL